ncbi:MAG: hypothetical protein HZB19_00910 [Chloroflexi bacterium]|nr:hypothetical protein [Chloroflexota bacterium]
MKIPIPLQFLTFGLVALILISAMTAISAANTVPDSNADHLSLSVSANDLKPAACSSIFLSNIVSGSGTITGTSGNDLIEGSSSADTIDGLGGDDCILGGDGDDNITGNDGADVCLGNAGTDTFTTCETESQ